jgi:hypothetical protein
VLGEFVILYQGVGGSGVGRGVEKGSGWYDGERMKSGFGGGKVEVMVQCRKKDKNGTMRIKEEG